MLISLRRSLRWGVPLAAVAAFTLTSARGQSPTPAAHAVTPRRVEVAQVELLASHRPLRYSGIVRAARRAELAFSIPGRIAERRVELGQRVQAGQLLAALDGAQYANAEAAANAHVAAAGARLAQLRRDRARVERLLEARAVSSEEVEQVGAGLESAEAGLAAAQAELAEARRLVREARLVAPFAGTVSELRQEPGEYVQPGLAVLALSGEDSLEVEIEVPEAQRLQLGAEAPVRVELPLAEVGAVPGRIRSLGRAAARAGRLFPVVIALDAAPGLAPGLTAEVVLTASAVPRPSVPVAAVVDPAGSDAGVFRVRGGRVERVPVAVLELAGTRVAVDAALAPGDVVVVAGHASLLDGEAVEVVR